MRRLWLIILTAFAGIGVALALWRGKWAYLSLMLTVGCCGSLTALAAERRRKRRSGLRTRRLMHWVMASFFVWLMVAIGLSFQFSAAVFDVAGGMVSGAVIQLVIARLILPLLFGNGFCSAVCWDGAVFDLLPLRGRRALPRWARLLPYVCVAATVAIALAIGPARVKALSTPGARLSWGLLENAAIIMAGLALTPLFGGRAYCRALCPFHAVSRLLARHSVVKVGSTGAAICTACGRCDAACPFGVAVQKSLADRGRVLSSECILCERCVAACPAGRLGLTVGRPWE